jgi:hypothetical protein
MFVCAVDCLITTWISVHLSQRKKYDNLCNAAYFEDVPAKCVCDDHKLWGSHRIHMADR